MSCLCFLNQGCLRSLPEEPRGAPGQLMESLCPRVTHLPIAEEPENVQQDEERTSVQTDRELPDTQPCATVC